MGTRHLEAFFRPRSITVIGASEKPQSLGGRVLSNLLAGGFAGTLTAVNSAGYRQVHGVPCYDQAGALPQTPDLAILCTPPQTIPRLVRELGQQGVKAALVLIGGLSRLQSRSGRSLREAALEAARPYGIRLLGPNSLGVLVPGHKMNASYAHLPVASGKVAFVGESVILGSALIDWARRQDIGFSHFLTLGESADVIFADLIDYLASDWQTSAILLHIEYIRSARRFISAVRAASRGKLVLAIKSARVPEAQDPVQPVAPGLTDNDRVYDAVLRRAGVLRVGSSDELFAALETLTRMRPLRGERLAILSNGIGPGVLATDALIRSGGTLARLAPATQERLRQILPPVCSGRNPVNLNPDADPERYARALEVVTDDRGVDAVLVMHAPTWRASSLAIAQAVVEQARRTRLNVLASWIGGDSVAEARTVLGSAEIPSYATPEQAVQAFMHMVNYHRNQAILLQTPPSLPKDSLPDCRLARELIAGVWAQGRDYLTPQEARQVVAAYGIAVTPTRYCPPDPEAAVELLSHFPGPIALKIMHRAQCHPFTDGGPLRAPWRGDSLDLEAPDQVRHAAQRMQAWVEEHFPGSPVLGYSAQLMQRGLRSVQLNMGLTRDAVFGPLLVFGTGGPKTILWQDRQVGLPPLSLALARDLMRGSRLYAMLHAHNQDPEPYLERLAQTLVRLSQIIVDIPAIKGLEINPLLLNQEEVRVLDVAIDLGAAVELAIRPYPEHLREWVTLKSGRRVELRPIRGEDEPAHLALHQRLTPQAIRYRFFLPRRDFSHRELAQMTQIDYDREMVFIAEAPNEQGELETLGEVRAWIDADNLQAEMSILVRDDLQGEGLGRLLLGKLIDYCRQHGTLEMVASVLPENEPMLKLVTKLGFGTGYNPEEEVVDIRLPLNEPQEEWQRQRLSRSHF